MISELYQVLYMDVKIVIIKLMFIPHTMYFQTF